MLSPPALCTAEALPGILPDHVQRKDYAIRKGASSTTRSAIFKRAASDGFAESVRAVTFAKKTAPGQLAAQRGSVNLQKRLLPNADAPAKTISPG